MDDRYPVSVVLAVILPLGQGEELEELGEELLALLPAGLLPEVHHQVAGDNIGLVMVTTRGVRYTL